MFERRIFPVYLSFSALALAIWSALAPGATAASIGWVLAGMVALYAGAILIQRTTRSPVTVANALEEAARVNNARIAPPPPAHPDNATR